MADSKKIGSGYKKTSETKKHIETGKKFTTPEFTPKDPKSTGKGLVANAKADEPDQDSYGKVNTKNDNTEDSFKGKEYDVELEVKGKSMASIYYTNIIYNVRRYAEGRGQVVKKITIEMGDKPDTKITVENIEKLIDTVILEIKNKFKNKNAKL